MKKKLFYILAFSALFISPLVKAQTARVMAIHNSADPAADTVDVWLVAGPTTLKIADNLAFRKSTGFINAPAGVNIRLAFAGKTSTVITDTLAGFGFNLTPNATYILFAQGHLTSGFTPQKPFQLNVLAPARERNITAGDSTSFAVYHGSTDAPAVDIYVRGITAPLVPGAAYGAVTSYFTVPTANYTLDVNAAGNPNTLLTYQAPLQSLGLQDSALVVFASGFLNPSANKNGKGFGLFAALSNGAIVALPQTTNAKVQVIHNSPDAAAASVDLWLINKTTGLNSKIADNVMFRKASPFLDLPANQNLSIGVAGPTSTVITDTLLSQNIGQLKAGESYVAVANGVVNTNNFEANPGSKSIGFRLTIFKGKEKSAIANKVELAVVHGSTDAPAVDIGVPGGTVLVPNVSFGDATASYLTVDPANIRLLVLAAGTSTVVKSYSAPLSLFKDSALVAFASGFLSPNVPAGKDDGAAFGLFVATPGGTVIGLSDVTSVKETPAFADDLTMYPNPATSNVVIQFTNKSNPDALIYVTDLAGKTLINQKLNALQSGTQQNNLDVSSLSEGIYFVRITGESGESVKKLIIQ